MEWGWDDDATTNDRREENCRRETGYDTRAGDSRRREGIHTSICDDESATMNNGMQERQRRAGERKSSRTRKNQEKNAQMINMKESQNQYSTVQSQDCCSASAMAGARELSFLSSSFLLCFFGFSSRSVRINVNAG